MSFTVAQRWRHLLSLMTVWKLGVMLVLIFVAIGLGIDWNTTTTTNITTASRPPEATRSECFSGTSIGRSSTNRTIVFASPGLDNIAPGELPGYTGWGRPEKTLARFFTVHSVSTDSPQVDQEFVVTVKCQGHEDCDKGSSWFYLRAYGPAVVPGTMTHHSVNQKGWYDMTFVFRDPGMYTVEVVLTFSNTPPISSFPIQTEQPAYEGFLLPGFPLLVSVQQPQRRQEQVRKDAHRLCTFDDFTETSPTSAMNKARWKVTGRSNGPGYDSQTIDSPVSTRGYISNVNSLGIRMEYQYLSNCKLLPEEAFHKSLKDQRVFARCPRKIQIIYIGDSVLRVQKDKMREFINQMENVELNFLMLHLGYRRNQILGPANIQRFLDEIQHKAPNDAKVILFNTGLHDIHQLCGAENEDDRRKYLNSSLLVSDFSCTAEYRALLKDFIAIIQNFPADLKVFQTSTAAWPKYGNWGIEWNTHGQAMPLVSDFCAAFNYIAFEVLAEQDGIGIMDGYWITYSRPDNREIGEIGKKLSHPGDEVLSFMSRIWAKMILDKVCYNQF
mmetsp:Transcript_9013/g.14455  ORF Transcript_9013/g.14455 Transcript_9013/m.14455 type:complete len:555 (-) Transcript_9013:256-1920(-)